MINCMRINESVMEVMRGYAKTPSKIISEVEKKLGKPVDEHKWDKAKKLAEKKFGRGDENRFYSYTMEIYKKMMGEASEYQNDAMTSDDDKENKQGYNKPADAFSRGAAAKRKGLKLEKSPMQSDSDFAEFKKGYNSVKESEDEGSKEELDAAGQGGDDFKAGKDCKPPSSYSEKQKAAYREGYKYAEDRDSTKRANDANHEMNENEDHENGEDEKKYSVGGHKKKFTLKDAKQKAEEIRKKTGIIVSVEKIDESEDHDEEKETQEDPTREKLETAKDEADEKKGGPAELAADLRVSVRIEKMGIGRYKRMLTKHELSSDDEEWLKKRIEDLEDCIKSMEAKIPELEKEAEGKDIKESMIKGIRQAIFELAKG